MSHGAGGWEIELLHRLERQKQASTSDTSSRSAHQTVYLTFDDGPVPGTDDVIEVLNAKQVRGTLFMVGDHAFTDWRKSVVKNAHASKFVEVANHSKTHANSKYAQYYSEPAEVLAGFKSANKTLGLSGDNIPARLPGRNTWRVGEIVQNDHGSGPAADQLKQSGFTIYGWDLEWHMTDNGVAKESPSELFQQIKSALARGETKKKDKLILLTHDVMFKSSTKGRSKLEELIDLLVAEGYSMEFISNY